MSPMIICLMIFMSFFMGFALGCSEIYYDDDE